MGIAILGAGNLGRTLGKKWALAGHTVLFGSRDLESPKVKTLIESYPEARVVSLAEAINGSRVILFATPYTAVSEIVQEYAENLADKLIFDATNNFGFSVVNNLETIAHFVPTACLYRAFNASGWENFADPIYGEEFIDLFYCGADDENRPLVEDLIYQIGLRPVWVGDLDLAPVVDALGTLWVTLVFRRGLGRGIALKLLSR